MHVKIRKSLLNRILKAANPNYQDTVFSFICFFYDAETFRHYDEEIHARSANEALKIIIRDGRLTELYKIEEKPFVPGYQFNEVYKALNV